MKYFFRAVRYVLPYRGRLAIALLCVLLISASWAGGIAMCLPALKILISEEGLHGWADQSMVDCRLGLHVIKHTLSSPVDGHDLPDVMQVASLEKDGPATRAGLTAADWIIGFDSKYQKYEPLEQTLAALQGDAPWTLSVCNSETRQERTVIVQPAKPKLQVTALYAVASHIYRPKSMTERLPMFFGLLGLCVVLTVFRGTARFFQEYFAETAIQQGIMDLRCETYEVSLRLPVSYFSSRGTSDTMSRFVQDTGEISRGLITLLGKTLVEPGKFIATFIVALCLNWQLTLLACIAGPPSYYLIRRLSKQMKRASKKALQGWAGALTVLEETFVGIRVVKGFTMESAERKRFLAVNNKLYKEQRKMAAIEAVSSPAIESLGLSAAMVAAGYAGYLVLNGQATGQMDSSKFLVYLGALFALFDPVRKLSEVSTRFHRADAAAARVFELHDQPTEPELPEATDLPRHSKSLEFRDLRFTYDNSNRPAVDHVSLKIRHGETVAIVGGNGSGKTTLLSLVPRFFVPQSGSVLIDGTDISTVTLKSLRQQIGIVTQETIMFHATVAENIAYGAAHATKEQILAAARQAFVDEFVQQMPGQYDAMIGEHGATLSGGQRQRIAIARAILRNPTILIFDEAMSQIDSESEAKINQALEGFVGGRTTLMIAHRFSTVIGADRVVVMNEGKLIDVGKHDELLDRCPTYRTLFETQLMPSSKS